MNRLFSSYLLDSGDVCFDVKTDEAVHVVCMRPPSLLQLLHVLEQPSAVALGNFRDTATRVAGDVLGWHELCQIVMVPTQRVL